MTIPAAVFVFASSVAALAVAPPAAAAVTAVKGYACGYYTEVGLFGGPQSKLGCEPQISRHTSAPASATTLSPSVQLPPGGSATPITATDSNGAQAKYGPATIFGGIWPVDVASATPSGPITVSTQGTTGPNGSVTSSARIGLHPTPVPTQCWTDPDGTANCLDPGGFGPPPVWGDVVHVECSANETSVSGSTTFTNSFVATATDTDGVPLKSATFPIPTNPPANYTVSGVISNVGDLFTAVFNEQIINHDGSITVNGVHMYLFGPIAIGEIVKGQATCGTTPTTVVPRDTTPPHCGITVMLLYGPAMPSPREPREELTGVFDAGGIQSVTNIQATNATVRVGMGPNNDAEPLNDYLTFVPGQTGPLSVVATRVDESKPMSWSFDVTDKAGNTTHCVNRVTKPYRPTADFDGDVDTDIGVFRPSTAVWYLRSPASSTLFGTSGDIPVPADYNGDGRADRAVFRPSTGVWYNESLVSSTPFGQSGDIPVPGDYDNDGDADIAVFRPSTGVWYIHSPASSTPFGVNGDIPVPADYDNDGDTDLAVFRPSTGVWYIRTPASSTPFGVTGDIPVPADYGNDGDADIAVFRPSTGVWYVHNPASSTPFGVTGDIPVPGDYDGDGASDLAVYRPSNGVWYVQNPASSTLFGTTGDVPVPLPPSIRVAFFT